MSIYRVPGYQGGPFTPASLSGLVLWLDASVQGSVKTNGSRQYTAANSTYHSIADNADLSMGDIDCTFAAWVYFDSVAGTQGMMLKGHRTTFTNQREYQLYLGGGTARFAASSDGTDANLTIVDEGTTLSIDTWYFVVAWHDASANTINIQLNNGTAASAAHAGGVNDGAFDFHLGVAGGDNFLDGRLDTCAVWKRTLTAAEKTFLYNSGTSLHYSEIGIAGGDGSALKTSLIAWWDQDQCAADDDTTATSASGAALDAHGSNDLTENNEIEAAGGNGSSVDAVHQSVVRLWEDKSGNGYDFFNDVEPESRPIYKTSQLNGMPIIDFQGDQAGGDSAHYLYTTTDIDNSTNGEFFCVYNGEVGPTTPGFKALFSVRESGASPREVLQLGYDWVNQPPFDHELSEHNQADEGAPTEAITGTKLLEAASANLVNISAGATSYRFYLNGSTLTPYTGPDEGDWFGVIEPRDAFAIGGTLDISDFTLASNCRFACAEIILYNRQLSLSERARVETYLNMKWAAF